MIPPSAGKYLRGIAVAVALLGTDFGTAPGAAPGSLFPNAPRSPEWRTYADYRWGERPGDGGTYDRIPLWLAPTYDRDNGSHVVDYSGDPPDKGKGPPSWPAQLSRIIAADGVPGGGKALEIRFPEGFPGGSSPARIYRHPRYDGDGLSWSPSDNTGFLYVGLYFKLSPGFTLNGNVAQKLMYANSNLPANSSLNHIVLNLRTANRSGLYPAYEPQHPFNLHMVPATPENDVNDGRWHLFEILQAPNTPGIKNGLIRIYLDGRLAGSWTNALLFDRGQTASLNMLSLHPVYGGGRHPVPAEQQLLYGPLLIMGH